jgi:hypothetical protein
MYLVYCMETRGHNISYVCIDTRSLEEHEYTSCRSTKIVLVRSISEHYKNEFRHGQAQKKNMSLDPCKGI